MFRRAILIAALAAAPAFAGPAKISNVVVSEADGMYNFDVTVSHADTGWENYVDAWRIKDEAGNVLGVRALAHPHVGEQPFTRSLSGVTIPDGVTVVIVEVHDSVTGWDPDVRHVNLP